MVTGLLLDIPVEGLDTLSETISGRIITHGDAEYDDSRAVWNALRDRRPAAIVRPETVEDVVNVTTFAREQRYLLSAKSGGHGVTGGAMREGGITIDFSRWNDIEIDPSRRVARVQPGATWGEFDAAAQKFGLATPGGKIATLGVGGSALTGGIGWLARKHGLAIDHLRAVEIVTGDGHLRRATANEDSDLFWGARGAGALLGIATTFEFDLLPVGLVLAGFVAHPVERAREVLAFYHEFTATAPEALTSMAVLTHGPGGRKVAAIVLVYSGDLRNAEGIVAPLRAFGPPVLDTTGVASYGTLQRELAHASPAGNYRSMKSAFIETPSDDLIDTIADAFSAVPGTDTTILIEHHGGVINRIAPDAMAYPHRNEEFNLVIETGWRDPVVGSGAFYWLANTWNSIRPRVKRAAYVAFLDVDDRDRAIEAYGFANFGRLRQLKARYDPGDMLATLPGLHGGDQRQFRELSCL